jgi:hypothetical protein
MTWRSRTDLRLSARPTGSRQWWFISLSGDQAIFEAV